MIRRSARRATRRQPTLLCVICAIGMAACTGDDPILGHEPNEIRVWVSAVGSGDGSIMGSPSPADIDCRVEDGAAVSGDCSVVFQDAGGGGIFHVTAIPDAEHVFAGWDDFYCTSDVRNTCDIDCGENQEQATCGLTFAASAGDAEFYLTARFESSLNTVVIEDDFETVNACDAWSSNVAGNGTFVATDGCEPAGGDPNGYRTMTHEVTDVGNVVVSHWFSGETYDPSVEGAIERIDYSEDHIITQPAFVGGAVGLSFRLEQGGTWYTYTIGGFDDTQWASYAVSLTPADFVPAPGPDFSNSGGEIQFGYVRSNSNTTDGATSTSVHGIDNWRVVIVQAQ